MTGRPILLLLTLLLLIGTTVIIGTVSERDLDLPTVEEEDDDETDTVFIPTHEWQEIKKGQSVPAGLHYRINLQTGQKEAKLLDETGDTKDSRSDNKKTTDVQLSDSEFYGHSDRRGVINKSTKLFTRAELREMLKKIKDDSPAGDFVPLLTSTGRTPNEEGEVPPSQATKQPLSTFEELKEMLTFHVDVEIMLLRLQILVDPDSTPDQLISALEELEYYVHQIDNARDFDVLGGLSVVVRLLNYTADDRVQSAAALVLGAATQGNPVVQQLATSYRALPTLLSLVSSSQTELLLRRVLYALGSLLRGQPTIVQSFIGLGGIEKLSEVADSETQSVFVKVIVLLTDLLSVEGLQETTGITNNDLQARLSGSGWCAHTSQLLQSTSNPVAIEKCVLLMDKLLSVCDYSHQYKLLHQISKRWNRNGEERELMDTVKDMLERIKSASKEEL